MKVLVSPEAKLRFRRTLLLYRSYMTKREAARRAAKVKMVLRVLGERAGEGAYEELLDTPADGIRYRRAIAGHFKIIYRVVEGVVEVSDIFDSRQDPQKMRG
ncbi:MAG: hypothetical protein MUE88_01880 [Flavobacteriales bacterium]|nr:hypothetical protein [Flavobacteriales bacterium]